MLKRKISDVYNHKYTKIKINLVNGLPLEKASNKHNVVILVKTAFNENCNHYYRHVLLEKCSYKYYKNALL